MNVFEIMIQAEVWSNWGERRKFSARVPGNSTDVPTCTYRIHVQGVSGTLTPLNRY